MKRKLGRDIRVGDVLAGALHQRHFLVLGITSINGERYALNCWAEPHRLRDQYRYLVEGVSE